VLEGHLEAMLDRETVERHALDNSITEAYKSSGLHAFGGRFVADDKHNVAVVLKVALEVHDLITVSGCEDFELVRLLSTVGDRNGWVGRI
jgi:hypothetical protein